MMPTAITFAAAFTLITTVASAAAPGDTKPAPAGPTSTALPPLAVTVYAADTVSPSLVARTLAEADAIWRAGGVTLDWHVAPRRSRAAAGGRTAADPPGVRVLIDNERGQPMVGELPIGWIAFDARGVPQPLLHVSRTNGLDLLAQAWHVTGRLDRMPPLEQEVLLSRALGRALAHELGHYLLASRTHTRRGLMQGTRSAAELFAPSRPRYEISRDERRAVAIRVWDERRVAMR